VSRRFFLFFADDLSASGGLFSAHLREYRHGAAHENHTEHEMPGASHQLPRHEKTSLLLGYPHILSTTGGHRTKKNALPAQTLDQKDAIVLS
jgi:hypothetical protein